MKVVILAGGKGTRLSEETRVIPKPMVEIAGKPILEHIMEIYEEQGFSDFLIATGYRGQYVTANFLTNEYEYEKRENSVFFCNAKRSVEIVFTGVETQTGGRLKRLRPFLKEPFLMTYGDGVGNIQIRKVLDVHQNNESLVTLTAVHPTGRFGSIEFFKEEKVIYFGEKVDGSNQWINGGFMVINPKILDYIQDDQTNFEKSILPALAELGNLHAYKHDGFWMCMDTLRDKENLEEIINEHGKIWLCKS